MKTLIIFCFFFLNLNNPSIDTCFKYISQEDTVIVLESDIVRIDTSNSWIFFLNERTTDKFLKIQDDSGDLYFFCEKDKCWIRLPQMRWIDSEVPSGWYVKLNKDGTIINEDHSIVLRFDRLYSPKDCLCKRMLSREHLRLVRKLSRKN